MQEKEKSECKEENIYTVTASNERVNSRVYTDITPFPFPLHAHTTHTVHSSPSIVLEGPNNTTITTTTMDVVKKT